MRRPTLAKSVSQYLEDQAEGNKSKEGMSEIAGLSHVFTQEVGTEQQATYPPLKGVVLIIPLYQACSLLNTQEGRAGGIDMLLVLQMKKLRLRDLTQLTVSPS